MMRLGVHGERDERVRHTLYAIDAVSPSHSKPMRADDSFNVGVDVGLD